MDFTPFTLAIITSVALLAFGEGMLFFLFFRFLKRLNASLGAMRSGDILKTLVDVMERSESVDQRVSEMVQEARVDRKQLQQSLQKVGFVRFNPFSDMGGEQSFCLALLDGEENGVVMTSLCSKEGIRTYAKHIVAGSSEQRLSREEEEAVREAQGDKRKLATQTHD